MAAAPRASDNLAITYLIRVPWAEHWKLRPARRETCDNGDEQAVANALSSTCALICSKHVPTGSCRRAAQPGLRGRRGRFQGRASGGRTRASAGDRGADVTERDAAGDRGSGVRRHRQDACWREASARRGGHGRRRTQARPRRTLEEGRRSLAEGRATRSSTRACRDEARGRVTKASLQDGRCGCGRRDEQGIEAHHRRRQASLPSPPCIGRDRRRYRSSKAEYAGAASGRRRARVQGPARRPGNLAVGVARALPAWVRRCMGIGTGAAAPHTIPLAFLVCMEWGARWTRRRRRG
jgi:hypothetical protein